jgi:hypothetical protein
VRDNSDSRASAGAGQRSVSRRGGRSTLQGVRERPYAARSVCRALYPCSLYMHHPLARQSPAQDYGARGCQILSPWGLISKRQLPSA